MDMRTLITLVEGVRRANMDQTLEQIVYSFGDWLNGDAMNLVNDEGERYSAEPYYAALEAMAKIAPPNHLKALHGTIYRGVGFMEDPSTLAPGRIQTAAKRYQSWTADIETAKGFANNYGGNDGVIFAADVDANRRSLVISVRDVHDWAKSLPEATSWSEQFAYDLERYASQDEIIIRGSKVVVKGVKVVRKPRR